MTAYANEEFAQRAWKSLKDIERESTYWHDFREVNDTMVSGARGTDGSGPAVRHLARYSSYIIEVNTVSRRSSELGQSEADIARLRTSADSLALTLRARMGDPSVSTRPGELRAGDTDAATDACELLKGGEIDDMLLARARGLDRYGRTLSPFAARQFDITGSESFCRRTGGVKHYAWADGPEPSRPPASGPAGDSSETLGVEFRSRRFANADEAARCQADDHAMHKRGARGSEETVAAVKGVGRAADITEAPTDSMPYVEVEAVVGDQLLTLKAYAMFRPKGSTWSAPERATMIELAKLAASRMG